MRRVLLACVAGLLFLTSNLDAQDDLRKLQGKWIQIAVEGDGNKLENSDLAPAVIIDDDRWIELSSAGDSIASFTINPRKEPKQIDRRDIVFVSRMPLTGIYKLEDNTLTLAFPFPFGGKLVEKRPLTFATKPGDWFVVITYRRAADDTLAELQPLPWGSDWKASFQAAKAQRRLVFVDYFASWCKPCLDMEATVFRLPDVKRRLNDFVLLRVDVDRGKTAWAQKVNTFPTYAIYDPYERERFRWVGAANPQTFRSSLDGARSGAKPLLDAADLLEAKKDVEGQFLVGNTYSRLGMSERARDVYAEARKSAEARGDKANAQLAEALWAFTFAREGNPSRAVKLLLKLTEHPADRDTEALIWLTLGKAYQAAKESQAAVNAYQHARSVATPDSRAFQEASAAIAKAQ